MLRSWDEAEQICEELHKLRILNLTGNLLKLRGPCNAKQYFHLRQLVLNHCGVDFTAVQKPQLLCPFIWRQYSAMTQVFDQALSSGAIIHVWMLRGHPLETRFEAEVCHISCLFFVIVLLVQKLCANPVTIHGSKMPFSSSVSLLRDMSPMSETMPKLLGLVEKDLPNTGYVSASRVSPTGGTASGWQSHS